MVVPLWLIVKFDMVLLRPILSCPVPNKLTARLLVTTVPDSVKLLRFNVVVASVTAGRMLSKLK